jgi:hypothetical protein
MQFTNEVNWTAADFIVAAILLLGTGFIIEVILRLVKTPQYRFAICAALLFSNSDLGRTSCRHLWYPIAGQ